MKTAVTFNGVTDPGLIVQRRFPTFDFVLDSNLAPTEAASKLETFLSQQQRPRGFVITDPRVDGEVHGATFKLQRREAGFGGSVRPYAEGYFLPKAGGSHVYVRVQISRWWWLFSAVVFAGVLNVSLKHSNTEAFMLVVFSSIALVSVSAIPVWLEGSQMAKLMRRVVS